MDEQHRRVGPPYECPAALADPLAVPAWRDSATTNVASLDRSDEAILRRLCKHGASIDADDALRSERRVGEQPARVATTALCIRLRSEQSQRRSARRCEPCAKLERCPVVLPAAERNEDSRARLFCAPSRGEHADVCRRTFEQGTEGLGYPIGVETHRAVDEYRTCVISARETNDVTGWIERREDCGTRLGAKRRTTRIRRRRLLLEVALVLEQARDNEFPPRGKRKRLGHREKRVEPLRSRRDDENGSSDARRFRGPCADGTAGSDAS